MKKCPKCGNEADDNAAFCSICGTALESESAAAESSPSGADEAGGEAGADNAEGTADTSAADPGADEAAAAEALKEPAPGPAPEPAPGPAPEPGPAPGPIPGQDPHNGSYYQQGSYSGNYHQEPYRHPSYDPKDHTREFDPRDIEDNRLIAVLPYLFSVFGMIAAVLIQDSPFVRFHLKNEIRLTIASLIAALVCLVPFLGWVVGVAFLTIICVLKIVVFIQALSGKAKEIPILCGIDFLK